MTKLKHLLTNFCWLDLEAIKVHHFYDTSWSKKGVMSTKIIWQCRNCHKTETQSLYGVGFLELTDVKRVKYD